MSWTSIKIQYVPAWKRKRSAVRKALELIDWGVVGLSISLTVVKMAIENSVLGSPVGMITFGLLYTIVLVGLSAIIVYSHREALAKEFIKVLYALT